MPQPSPGTSRSRSTISGRPSLGHGCRRALTRADGSAVFELPGGECQMYVHDPGGNVVEVCHPDAERWREQIPRWFGWRISIPRTPMPIGPRSSSIADRLVGREQRQLHPVRSLTRALRPPHGGVTGAATRSAPAATSRSAVDSLSTTSSAKRPSRYAAAGLDPVDGLRLRLVEQLQRRPSSLEQDHAAALGAPVGDLSSPSASR